MSATNHSTPKHQIRRIEVVAIVVIFVILAALLVPRATWVADGQIEVPVRILVFDSQTASPIPGADVWMLRGPSWYDDEFLDRFREWQHDVELQNVRDDQAARRATAGKTTDDGTVLLSFAFSTISSDRNPDVRVNTQNVWCFVRAKGYGQVVVRVTNVQASKSALRRDGELRVPIGLAADR